MKKVKLQLPKCFNTFASFSPQTQAENGCWDCKIKTECFKCDVLKDEAQAIVEKYH